MTDENETSTTGGPEEKNASTKTPAKRRAATKAQKNITDPTPTQASEDDKVFLMPEEKEGMSEETKGNILMDKLRQIGVLGSKDGESIPHGLWQKLQSIGVVPAEGDGASKAQSAGGAGGAGSRDTTHDKGFWSQMALGFVIVAVVFMFFRAISHKPANDTMTGAPQSQIIENLGRKAEDTPDWAKERIQRMDQLRDQFSAEMDALRQEQLQRAQGANQTEMPDWLRQHMDRIERLREEMRLEMESLRNSVLEHQKQVPPKQP
ncbi:MAG: hypothetical protein A2286_03035 [Gammaproteobacteria bacterium RIFOXYA12_FULL_61_12]|nr:MAG: hypothetical protein A2514_00880 [Gammaproteobacteria bacterium RIFOXYD12_FULL_61_37]OGT93864.1 MAG: hypothetical protein A2286_03035 [Gammaproteobacteria bacterium RIFOXYA12_FULL_61_12]